MEFALSATQQLLVGIAREFLDKHALPAATGEPRSGDPLWRIQAVAGSERDATGHVTATTGTPGGREALWQEMAGLGWPGLLVPQALGGSGGSLLDVVLLVEEMGRAGFSGPYIESAVAATSVLLEAADPRHDTLLAAMAAGDRIVSVARAEDDDVALTGGARPGRRGDGGLDGRALFVLDADIAAAVLIAARDGGRRSLLLVPMDRPGVTLVTMPTMSGERRFEVRLAGVTIGERDRVGGLDRVPCALAAGLRAGAVARAGEMVGAAQRILDLVVAHAKVRVQSDRPIGSFQAIQHTCADILRNVESARWIVRRAAWAAANGEADAGAAVAIAKAWTGDACLAVARRAHQVLGAIGYCDEHPLHRLHKAIHVAAVDFGDTAEHLETVAGAIGLVGPGP